MNAAKNIYDVCDILNGYNVECKCMRIKGPVGGTYGPSLKLLQHVTMFDRQLYVSASAGISYLYHFAYVLLHYK